MKKAFIICCLTVFAAPPLDYAAETSEEEVPPVGSFYKSALKNTYFINANRMFSWYEAYIDCTFRGMQLLTIENEQKFEDIVQLLKDDNKPNEGCPIWIGAIGNAQRFTWTATGRPLILDTKLWLINNPDNFQNIEHCVQIYGDLKHLNDRKCADKLGYACEERPAVSASGNADSSIKYKHLILNFGNRYM